MLRVDGDTYKIYHFVACITGCKGAYVMANLVTVGGAMRVEKVNYKYLTIKSCRRYLFAILIVQSKTGYRMINGIGYCFAFDYVACFCQLFRPEIRQRLVAVFAL